MFAFVILRNKAMLKFSTYFFLMVMSIADTLVLYAGLLPIWIGQLINGSLHKTLVHVIYANNSAVMVRIHCTC